MYNQPVPDYSAKKTMGMVIGVILMIVGGILMLIGLSLMSGPSPSLDDPNWAEKSDENFQKFGQGAGMSFFGFFLLGTGFFIIYITNIRKVATYMAVETMPAVNYTSRAMGSGISQGINDSGGIRINNGHHDKPSEVVKVKCRECGYLDSEDAKFCSKCGKPL